MYTQMPHPSARIDELARKINAIALALNSLKDYAQPYGPGDIWSEEDSHITELEITLYHRYIDHTHELHAATGRYVSALEDWRTEMGADNAGLVRHMGPLMPVSGAPEKQSSFYQIIDRGERKGSLDDDSLTSLLAKAAETETASI